METTKDFILHLYDIVNNEGRTKIKEEFPNLFPTVSIGKWYKVDDEEFFPKTYIFVTGIDDNGIKGYGFIDGVWYDNTKNSCVYTQANDPDLKLVLQSELDTEVRELFEEEVICRYGENWKIRKIKTDAFGRKSNNTALFVPCVEVFDIWNENGQLYYKGNWAEVFPEEEFRTLKKKNAEILLSSLIGEEIRIN